MTVFFLILDNVVECNGSNEAVEIGVELPDGYSIVPHGAGKIIIIQNIKINYIYIVHLSKLSGSSFFSE